jgi:hypothetical protein
MDMKYLLFENPLYVMLLLAVVEAALVAAWVVRRERPLLLYVLAGPPALALAAGLLAALVQTDREKIHQAMREIGAGLEANSLEPAEDYLDANFAAPLAGGTSLTRQQILAAGRTALDTHRLTSIKLDKVQTQTAGANGTTSVVTRVETAEGVIYITWRIQWARREAGWRIIRLELVKPDFLREFKF